MVEEILTANPFLGEKLVRRLVRAYGTDVARMLDGAKTVEDLGEHFGEGLTEREVSWLMTHEFARTAADVVWRRSKLGLRLSEDEIARLDQWMKAQRATGMTTAAQ